jgi:hypothetical protein
MSNGLSDHDAQILTLNNLKFPNSPNYPVCISNINEFSKSEFKLNLSCETWINMFAVEDDVNVMLIHFLSTCLMIFNHSFPYKKHFSKQKNKTWLTNYIKTSYAHKREF